MLSERNKIIITASMAGLMGVYLILNWVYFSLAWKGFTMATLPVPEPVRLVHSWRDFLRGKPVNTLRILWPGKPEQLFQLPRQTENVDSDGNEIYTLSVSAQFRAWLQTQKQVQIVCNRMSSKGEVQSRLGEPFLLVDGKRIFFISDSYLERMVKILEINAYNRYGLIRYPRAIIRATSNEGLDRVEGPYPQYNLPSVQWGCGPKTRLYVQASQAASVCFQLYGRNQLSGQVLRVRVNGKEAARFTPEPGEQFTPMSCNVFLHKGENEITIAYSRWNSFPGDDRPLAVLYSKIIFKRAE